MRCLLNTFLFTLLMTVYPKDASGAEPKFHYQDCVSVTSGFYRGCHGRVNSYVQIDGKEQYEINLTCRNNSGAVTSFDTSILKLIKDSACKDL